MIDLETIIQELQPGMAAVLGAPFDESSSFMRGPALAPARIREALHSGSANLCTERGLDLGADPRWRDVGDVTFSDEADAFEQIRYTIAQLVARDVRVLTLGGDHSITYPVVRGYSLTYPKLNILHLDAHPDLYDEFDGQRYSNACPFARIMEEHLAARLVQVGIRTMNPQQRHQTQRFGVEVIEVGDWHVDMPLDFNGPVYLSLDMDVLDPAFAPGVSHHEPGGISTRDVLNIIQGLKAPLVGADLVEFNPVRDPVGVTAMVAAKFLKEIVARMMG